MKSPYEILGVPRDATEQQLKAARRAAATRLHPDRPGGSPEAMAEVNKAYDTLIDPEARAHYDRTGATRGIDPLGAAVRDGLIQALTSLLERGRMADGNALLSELKAGFSSALNQANVQRATEEHKARQLRRRADRLSSKSGNTLLTDVIRGMADQLDEKVQKLTAGIAGLEAVLALLAEYEEQGDEALATLMDKRRQSSSWQGIFGGNGT
jgi:curved DNA-binding protein CbpA